MKINKQAKKKKEEKKKNKSFELIDCTINQYQYTLEKTAQYTTEENICSRSRIDERDFTLST